MSKRRASRKDRCPNCHINFRLCFCDIIKRIELKTKVTLILHASEVNLTSNTGTLAHKLLSNSEILLRGELEKKDQKLELSLNPHYKTYYLFPDEGAQTLNENFLSQNKGPLHLVVPDGSWRQAKKFKRREDALKELPSLKLEGDFSSNYFLRTEPKEGCLSTIEAISKALFLIEGKEASDHLEKVFSVMVERTLWARSGRHHL